MTVDLFIPCFIDQLFPETGWSVVKTLEKSGVTVNYNPSQTCCGQPAYNSGYWLQSKKLAEKATSVYYNNTSLELIITNPFDGNYLVQVFNLTGTEVLRQDVLKSSMARVPASKLKNGVYLVRITPVLNQPSATFKIMVK